nr:uncharacterized protein LOC129156465 [Nothobranchius furzeri]
MRVSFNNSLFSICSEIIPDCLSLVDPQDDRVSIEVLFEDTNPGSVINQALPSFNTTSHCKIKLELQDEALRTRMVIVLYNYEEMSAIQIIATSDFSSSKLVLLDEVNNIPVYSVSFNLADSDLQNGVIFSLSTCPFAGCCLTLGLKMSLKGQTTKSFKVCSSVITTSSLVKSRRSVSLNLGKFAVCEGTIGAARGEKVHSKYSSPPPTAVNIAQRPSWIHLSHCKLISIN